MTTTKRLVVLAALGLTLAGPAGAQNLNDLGRVLQDQVLGPRSDPNRERDAYERGRQDQADQNRRDGHERQRANDDRRRYEDDRRRFEEADRRQRDDDRFRADRQRAWEDEQRARQQSRRY